MRYAEGIIRAIQALCSGYHGNRRKMRNEKQKGVEERARARHSWGAILYLEILGEPKSAEMWRSLGNSAKW